MLLFASSIIAGWTENWFVLNRLDSALHYKPAHHAGAGRLSGRTLGVFCGRTWGLRANISWASCSAWYPRLPGLAWRWMCATSRCPPGDGWRRQCDTGAEALYPPAFWWGGGLAASLLGAQCHRQLGLAFSLALRAQNVSGVDRARIYAAIRARLRTAPLSFFVPERHRPVPHRHGVKATLNKSPQWRAPDLGWDEAQTTAIAVAIARILQRGQTARQVRGARGTCSLF